MKRAFRFLLCLICCMAVLCSGCATFPMERCRSLGDLRNQLQLGLAYPEFITKAAGASLSYNTVSGIKNNASVLTGYSIQLTYVDDAHSPCAVADLRATDLSLADWDLMGYAFSDSSWDEVSLQTPSLPEDLHLSAYKRHRFTEEELASEKGLASIEGYLPPPDNGYLFDALYSYWDEGDIRYSLSLETFFQPTDQETYAQCAEQIKTYFTLLKEEAEQ